LASSRPAMQGPSPKRHTRWYVAIAAVLVATLLVVAAMSFDLFEDKSTSTIATINSPSTPVTGDQLFSAYIANKTLADAAYTQKDVYIQDVIDPGDEGVVNDPNIGQYYSTVDFGAVVMYWSHQSQALQISPLEKILAQCRVNGMGISVSGDYLLYLMDCQFATAKG
jgi:hypothetical protein